MRDIADAITQVCSAPIVEIERLIRQYAFSYIIGNSDLHAKNVSVVWDRAVRLTPAYDLLSTLPYPLDRNMALKLDGRDDNFRTSDFAIFGQRYGVPERATRAMLKALCKRAESWVGRMDEIGFDEKTTDSLKVEVMSRIAKIRR
jgi:serine/threonine-protein kinase HipA